MITAGMRTRILPAARVLPLLLFLGAAGPLRPDAPADDPIVAAVDSCLPGILEVQNRVRNIHPFLKSRPPIAVVEGGQFYVFDADSAAGTYRFVKRAPVEFQMPENVMASFPLACYGDRPSCVVTRKIFDSPSGPVTILHEFVHCGQAAGAEPRLKEGLPISIDAMRRKDYAWEITHPFPYADSAFVSVYGDLLKALSDKRFDAVRPAVRRLKGLLAPADYEYLVWIEWKEGMARLLENRMRVRLGLPVNNYGEYLPFSRVTFYCGGAGLIDWLTGQDPAAFTDGERLFHLLDGLGDP
jgi:hypothetical protein